MVTLTAVVIVEFGDFANRYFNENSWLKPVEFGEVRKRNHVELLNPKPSEFQIFGFQLNLKPIRQRQFRRFSGIHSGLSNAFQQQRSDPNHRGSFFDRDLKIATHPHG